MLQNPEPKPLSAQQVRALANQTRYLAILAQNGSIGASATEAGIPISTVEYWDSQDVHGFKEKKRQALASFLGIVEAEINRRAIQGFDKKLTFRGKVFDTERQFSDNLLMFRAKRLDKNYVDAVQASESVAGLAMQININLHPDAKPNQPLDSASDADSVTEAGP